MLVAVVVVAAGCAHRTRALPDGFYPVVPVDRTGARTVVLDPRVADPEDEGATESLAVDPDDYVPLVLARAPRATPIPDGRVGLDVALDAAHVEALRSFTARHLGQRVAIVAGGEVVSAHQVKAVIAGGTVQISRCSPRGCERLLTRLVGPAGRGALPNAGDGATERGR